MSLLTKILQKEAKVAVIGLGYVGLPLAVELCQVGFDVTGIDVDAERVQELRRGNSYIDDVPSEHIATLVKCRKLKATTNFKALCDTDVIPICVPTPLTKWKKPDISCIVEATKEVGTHLRPGQLIILESTTYPGTTEEIMLPILEDSSLKVGKDFFLGFSPERIDPGNKKYNIKNTPKIVSGVTEQCARLAKCFYQQFVETVIVVSSPRVAEMVKIYENIFRCVNIALVNELAMLCDRMKLNVWEVIDAASTKPYGFMPFYPGPGLGGHCIPIDPYYLAWKAREYDFHVKFIELAASINDNMPYYVCEKTIDKLNRRGQSIKDAKVLVMGVTYKKDIADIRESPALKIMNLLQEKGAEVLYNDPYVPELKTANPTPLKSCQLTDELLQNVDCVVIVAPHSCYPYEWLVKKANLIIDTRNTLKNLNGNNIIHL